MNQEIDTKFEDLCLALIHADTEVEVIQHLKDAGYWDKSSYWRWLGDEEFNYSTVGNQQSRAEQAIIEKLINSIDAKMIASARIAGYLPKNEHAPQKPDTPRSIIDARNMFFGDQLKNMETLSRQITVAATGAKPKEGNGRPCFSIIDDGEGQTPNHMPNTILSLHKGNKDKIKFAQGKFNMGGTGVLEFCGMDNNLQLVVSRRHPNLLPDPAETPNDGDWSFTVIRREDPTTDGKSSRFAYLAPLDGDHQPRRGRPLHFAADTLPLFPEKNQPYARAANWGTLFKLYEYDARRFGTNMMLDGGLLHRTRLLLPEPALPIRFHECRPYRGHTGSYDTAMLGLIEALKRDSENTKSNNVEWYDKLEFDVDGERFTARIYLFKNKNAAESYRRDEGVIFTYNGQCHAVMTKDFFRRKKVKQDYLWHSLLMFVDCSKIGTRAHERLFMNGRDRLRGGGLQAKLEAELEDQLGQHEELRELASVRRKRELAEQPKAMDSMNKVIEDILSRNPTLAILLEQGSRIKNPHKPESASKVDAGFKGKRFPTKFHFRSRAPHHKLIRDAHINSKVRIKFETDAANDYFKRDHQPGQFELYHVANGKREPAINYQQPRLSNGIARMSLSLPEDSKEGDELTFEALVTDPSRVDPFCNTFVLKVRAERSNEPGEHGETDSEADDAGTGKGARGKGQDRKQDSRLNIPNPIPIYEKDWAAQEPVFNKYTAVRIKRPPDAQENEGRYDYFINMDNVHLQTYLRDRPKLAQGMKLRFSVGMTLVALAMIHQERSRNREGRTSEDIPDDKVSVHEHVEQTTCAMAPFLLPMIENVGKLEEEEEYLSESAGESV